MNKQRVLVTGANGFIGKNLLIRLSERTDIETLSFIRNDSDEDLAALVAKTDAVIHLAGENRPVDAADFSRANVDLTKALCRAISKTGRNIPLIFTSSVQAEYDNLYGQSKLAAEQAIESFVKKTDNSTVIFRLVGVFGKLCKPNYNSVVATFCHNIARGIPIQISDPDVTLELAYIDDVVDGLLQALSNARPGLSWGEISQTYTITLGALAEQLRAFKNCRSSLILERVGIGLTRALYSTYVSYLPIEKIIYDLTPHMDERGIFVEALKTPDCGQFSFFTIMPGITRGSHYHHSKTEKFIVVSGSVQMLFRQLGTGETYKFILSSNKPQVIDTIPGWVHDITNIGNSEAIIMLWANEIFDQQHPDTISCEVK
jgi:UDP-2-acetamido-2,6-beta-L-arabino-hexul-4-ose reductase